MIISLRKSPDKPPMFTWQPTDYGGDRLPSLDLITYQSHMLLAVRGQVLILSVLMLPAQQTLGYLSGSRLSESSLNLPSCLFRILSSILQTKYLQPRITTSRQLRKKQGTVSLATYRRWTGKELRNITTSWSKMQPRPPQGLLPATVQISL